MEGATGFPSREWNWVPIQNPFVVTTAYLYLLWSDFISGSAFFESEMTADLGHGHHHRGVKNWTLSKAGKEMALKILRITLITLTLASSVLKGMREVRVNELCVDAP